MNNNTTSLARSIPYWLLAVLSLLAVAVGGWLVWENTSTMKATLLEGTATNVEVYVGQAWVTGGAAVLAAGIVGVLLTLGLAALKSVIPASSPAIIEPISTASDDASADAALHDDLDDQNGSSGSTATATKINVK